MAEAYGLSCCSSALVPKSKLLHSSEAHHCFMLKHSHHHRQKHRSALRH